MRERAMVIGLLGALALGCAGCVDYQPPPARAACEQMLRSLGWGPALPVAEGIYDPVPRVCDNLSRAVALGGVAFDPTRWADCLAEAAAAPRGQSLTPTWFAAQLPACRAMFQDLRWEGEGCSVSLECPDGGYCDASRAECPGICRAYTPLAEDCGAEHQVCDPAAATCQVRCVPLPGEGDLCEGLASRCLPGLFCRQGECLPPQPEGAACDFAASFGRGCQDGLFCDLDDTCRSPDSSGASCHDSEEVQEALRPSGTAGGLMLGSYPQCEAGLACAGGACGPIGEEGGACVPETWPTCLTGLACHPDSLRCQPLSAPGESCDGFPCSAEGACPLGEESPTCAERKPIGESCESHADCTQDAACRDGACELDLCRDFMVTAAASAAAAIPGRPDTQP